MYTACYERILVLPAASRPSINIRMSFFPKSLAKAFPIVVVQTALTDGPAEGWEMTREVTEYRFSSIMCRYISTKW